MSKRFDSYDSFIRDLDESGRLSDDPFEVSPEFGLLDDEDLDLIGGSTSRSRKLWPEKPTTAPKRKPGRPKKIAAPVLDEETLP